MKDKKTMQVQQQILYNLVQILDIFPQYSVTQHLWHIMRTKGIEKEPYFWDDVTLLSKIESYYQELNTELLNDY